MRTRGLADALGLRPKPANALQRVTWRMTTSGPGSWLFSKTMHRIDRALFRLTSGRFTMSSLSAGLPVVLLTTTGAKSGQRRTVPLVPALVDDDLVLLGTSFARPDTPGWVFNLAANARASISYRGRDVDVTAEELHGDEWQVAWDEACRYYWGYEAYARRVPHRRIRIFRLRSL